MTYAFQSLVEINRAFSSFSRQQFSVHIQLPGRVESPRLLLLQECQIYYISKGRCPPVHYPISPFPSRIDSLPLFTIKAKISVLSTRAGGGGAAPVMRVWWAGCLARVKVDIKSFHPVVKASKSVKRFERYGHFKITQFSPQISFIILSQRTRG